MGVEKDIMKLPSGLIINFKTLTGKDWKECLKHSATVRFKEGAHLADLAYWDKYEELITGWSRVKLDSLPLEDAQELRSEIIDQSNAGSKGPKETEKNSKN